jgi:hypothetical protein
MESELDTYPMVIENSVDDVLEVIMPVINAEIQKERENAVRDFASYYQADPLRVMEYLSQTKGGK